MNIKSFLKYVLDFIKNFIGNILPSSKHLLDVALAVVNTIKTVDSNNPELLNLLTALIPGNVDEAVLAKVREKLPQWIATITYLDNQADKTPEDLLKEGIDKLKGITDANVYSDALQTLFKLIGYEITDESISYENLQKISQAYYEKYGKPQGVPNCVAPKIYNPITGTCVDPI